MSKLEDYTLMKKINNCDDIAIKSIQSETKRESD